jgi:hypothetical protein
MKATGALLSLVAGASFMVGCASTVQVPVPPRVDLGAYPTIGLVEFSCDANDDLERLSTQEFLEALQAAQPGTRVVELGREERVLRSVDRRTWDARTLREVKQKHGVDAVLLGRLNLEQAKPDVDFSTGWRSLSMRADVSAALTARLVETSTGATMWTDSSQATANVAHAGFDGTGNGHFGARDPEATYGEMLGCLVYDITDDFRVHYITQRVTKGQQQTASAAGQE